MNKPLIRATGDFFSRFLLQKQRRHQILARSSTSTILNHKIYVNSSVVDGPQISSQISQTQAGLKFPYFMFNSLANGLNYMNWFKKLKEKEQNQIFSIQYQANDGIEDRIVVQKLKSIAAEIISVFDGHGGDKLSQYCSTHIVDLIDTYLSEKTNSQNFQTNPDQQITRALKYAYQQLQKDFYHDIFEPLLALNNRKIRNMGTCALTIIVFQKKIYVSNCGDSEAILVSKNQQNELTYTELSQRFSVNNKLERQRLMKKFPKDTDIIVEESNGCFYVKGRLQPTRSIGDYYLKYSHLFKGKGDFNGPYITSQPQIRIFNISQKDEAIVVASDGVWDFLQKEQVAKASVEEQPHSQILQKTLKKVADLHMVSIDDIKQIKKSEKRAFHDDISILVLKIGSQMKKPC